MARILSVPERIKLFKEINRVHRQMYGWRLLYENIWGKVRYIDIDRDTIDGFNEWIPVDTAREMEFYFQDSSRGGDITLLQGLFTWQAYYFNHIDPYKFHDFVNKLSEENFILDNSGKRIRPDINHQVRCLETWIEIQQRKDDGKIWISSNWLHDPDCYAAASSFVEAIGMAINDAAGGNKRLVNKLWNKFEEIHAMNEQEFKRALDRYFSGGKINSKNWYSAYVLAASRPWKIKNMEQLKEALEVENKHFQNVLEEFIQWFRDGGLNLGEEAEEGLRKRIRELYSRYPCDIAKNFCKDLIKEDEAKQSDVYLWWGGEPNRDRCYALLTLYFEIDPEDIGTSRFDENVSKNLETLINIAEKEYPHLSTYREIEPHVWRAIFS